MPSFEVAFHVPAQHRLETVRARSRGGPVQEVYWELNEYDAKGQLVSRYEAFQETDSTGARRSEWLRFDRTGRLVARQRDLAFDLDLA